MQKFSGEVQNDLRAGAHLPTPPPSKSGHGGGTVTISLLEQAGLIKGRRILLMEISTVNFMSIVI